MQIQNWRLAWYLWTIFHKFHFIDISNQSCIFSLKLLVHRFRLIRDQILVIFNFFSLSLLFHSFLFHLLLFQLVSLQFLNCFLDPLLIPIFKVVTWTKSFLLRGQGCFLSYGLGISIFSLPFLLPLRLYLLLFFHAFSFFLLHILHVFYLLLVYLHDVL